MLAKEVCENTRVIYIERLDLEAMTRYGGNRKKGLNRSMRFVRHGEIPRKIRIVAERLGVEIVEVNPAGTSITCSKCQHMDKESRDGERFECVACGRVMNADSNAACNIVNKGADINVPVGEGMFLERSELGRTRNPPTWVRAAPDADQRRENQARNRPATSSAEKHSWVGTRTLRARCIRVYNHQCGWARRPTTGGSCGAIRRPTCGRWGISPARMRNLNPP